MKQLHRFAQQVFLYIYVAELTYPPLTTLFPSIYVTLACLTGWLIFSFFENPEYYLKCRTYLFITLAFYLYAAIGPRVTGNEIMANRYMGLSLLFFGYLIYDYHKRENSLWIIKRMLLLAVALSLITAIITTNALMTDPYISRSIKSSGEYSANLAFRGIGGYHLIYFGAMATPICLHALLKEERALRKCILCGLLFVDLFMLFKSSYTTAIMIAGVTSLVYIFSRTMYSEHNRGFKLLVLTVTIVIFGGAFTLFFDEIILFFPPRIQQIFVGKESQSFIQSLYNEFVVDRWPTWMESIEAIERSPVLGIAFTERIITVGALQSGFGQHSFYLDTLALFGIPIGAVIIYIAMLPITRGRFQYSNDTTQKPLYYAILIATVLMYLFNNATESIALVVNLFFPYVEERYSD